MAAGSIISRARWRGRLALTEAEGKALLAEFGIAVPRFAVASGVDDAARKAEALTPPFAVKVMSRDILHKSDAGGVALGLADAAAVAKSIEAMTVRPAIADAAIDGWLVEEMVRPGCEVVVGGVHDPQFGPMLMVGLGGIFVEVLGDVTFRICPVTYAEAREMLDQLKGAALFDGVRGTEPVDREALIEVMLRVGGPDGLLNKHGADIAELDLNPVIASKTSAVAADARVILCQGASLRERLRKAPPGADLGPMERFRPLIEPRTVAVLGASTKDVTIANTFIRRMVDFGYSGALYPIHPKAEEIEGIKAYPSLGETPEPVDYAYVGIAADRIPDALAAANGRCRIAQVISSGFGEVEGGAALETDLVEKAHAAGVRVLGPNCLGTYSPRGRLTFPADAPKETGCIGVISQSGGLSTDIIKRGQWRGLRFSALVTLGNSADLSPCDLLEFYFDDPQTRAIGLYLEDIKDGRAFFDLLRSEKATKPVVLLRGGTSRQGQIAAASHTGALAGDDRGWQALYAQTPTAPVATLDAFLDALLALQHFTLRPDRPTTTVTLFGNGGGSSVLGADAFARVGLDVSPFGPEARRPLEAMGLPPGTSVVNPIDTPVRTLQEMDGWVAGEILDIVFEHARPDAVAMHLNLAAFVGRGIVDPVDNLFAVIEEAQKKWRGQAHFALALRSDGSPDLDDRKRHYREKARAIAVPVFDEIPHISAALAVVGHLERRLGARLAGG